jgi:hypothetical protein
MEQPQPPDDVDFLALVGKYASQSLREVRALSDLLIAKGLIAKAELDEQIRMTHDPGEKLDDIMDVS